MHSALFKISECLRVTIELSLVEGGSRNLPRDWLEYDLWRWRRIPKSVLDEIGATECQFSAQDQGDDAIGPLSFKSTSGYNPCVEGTSMEGIFSKRLDMARVANLLNMVGEVTTSPDGKIAEVDKITVFAEGPVMIKAKDEAELKTKASKLRETVFRAMDCAGCGICVARCTSGALVLDGQVRIDSDKCSHCGSCFGPCPVVIFKDDEMDI